MLQLSAQGDWVLSNQVPSATKCPGDLEPSGYPVPSDPKLNQKVAQALTPGPVELVWFLPTISLCLFFNFGILTNLLTKWELGT